ncbi:MAG: hypothetical protein N4A65_00615 [Cohaesibacter sp.]|jgi:hypothetical protein|nr:hypothetical protein [Cohaesibacter sp.]
MTTVIFVHGISNMPEPSVLQSLWDHALATDKPDNPGVEIGAYGASVDLVYWSDVLYRNYNRTRSGAESTTLSIEMSNALMGECPLVDDVSDDWIHAISQSLKFDPEQLYSSDVLPIQPSEATNAAAAEAIPLPWPLKKPLMRAFVRDAHHYLFNVEHVPRDGEAYFVRDEIRKRFVTKVQKAVEKGPVIVFSHSLGTVIAFDCLKNVPECPKVDQLITIGSPLGMSEIQDKLEPGYSAHDGFPHEKLTGDWVNVYDPVDIVSISDPKLRNDYLQSGQERVSDLRQRNGGLWTHGLLKYAAQSALRTALRTALERA